MKLKAPEKNKDDEPTLDEIVLKYREFRDKIGEIEAKATEDAKPYKEAMVKIENYFADYMHNVGLQSLPTSNGTAYQTTVTSITIENKDVFFNFAVANHKELLQFSCNKTALKDYEPEKNKKGEITKPGRPYPPGIKVTKLLKVNIRGA